MQISNQKSTIKNQPSGLQSGAAVSSWLPPLLIFLVVLVGYGLGPTRLPLVGEETCRARHGIEMAESGDWLVATNQGVPILDRPPLQYWLLALIHRWVHPLDPRTLRLFMAFVVLCTSLLIWWYARAFLSETGAFVAAVAYPTMGHVLDLGRRAETDGLFTLLLAGALLTWHYGYARRWRPVQVWALSSAVAALATLTKGSQVPVAFFGTIYLFLLFRRDWRYLLRWSHVLGLLLFAGIIAVWEVPFYLKTGWEGTRMTWLDPYTVNAATNVAKLLRHVGQFPFVVLGATLPWSVLLVGLCQRAFWQPQGEDEKLRRSQGAGTLGPSSVLTFSPSRPQARSAVVFALVAMALIFVPVWLSQGGLQRYVMPMYPLLAVVCGAVVQQCLAAPLTNFFRQFWRGYLRIVALVTGGCVAVFLLATAVTAFGDAGSNSRVGGTLQTMAQPWPLLLVVVLGTGLGVTLIWRQTAPGRTEKGPVVAFTLVLLLAACYNGPFLNARAKTAENIGPQVRALRQSLPAGVRLVSFGPVFHPFLYWYGRPIPILALPQTPAEVPADLEYFALDVYPDRPATLPFSWEPIAQFNMGRVRTAHPKHTVVVGRRIPALSR